MRLFVSSKYSPITIKSKVSILATLYRLLKFKSECYECSEVLLIKPECFIFASICMLDASKSSVDDLALFM